MVIGCPGSGKSTFSRALHKITGIPLFHLDILNEDETVVKKYNWGEGRCCHESYPYGTPDFPTPHFDLEFWVTLPWVLEKQPNE